MVARRYEFYFRVAKHYFTNERSEGSIFKTEVTVFHYTDRPKPVNNIFFFSSLSNDFVYSREKNSRKRYCDRGRR